MAGDDHERHLQRERNQVPESAAPRVDRFSQRGRCDGERRRKDRDGRGERKDEGVGNPPLAPRGQLKRELRDETVAVGVG